MVPFLLKMFTIPQSFTKQPFSIFASIRFVIDFVQKLVCHRVIGALLYVDSSLMIAWMSGQRYFLSLCSHSGQKQQLAQPPRTAPVLPAWAGPAWALVRRVAGLLSSVLTGREGTRRRPVAAGRAGRATSQVGGASPTLPPFLVSPCLTLVKTSTTFFLPITDQ